MTDQVRRMVRLFWTTFFAPLQSSPLPSRMLVDHIPAFNQPVSSLDFDLNNLVSKTSTMRKGCTCRMAHSRTDMPVRQCNVILWSQRAFTGAYKGQAGVEEFWQDAFRINRISGKTSI